MKKILILLIMGLLLLPNIGISISETPNLKVTMLNQDPYPGNPGEYLDLAFIVENIGNKQADNVKFTLLDSFPFYINSEDERDIQISSIKPGKENSVILKYVVRVDGNALDKNYEIKLQYNYQILANSNFIEKFDIKIGNPRSDFDVIVQSIDETVSLAILNIGKNDAKSVVVGIPQQDNFGIHGPNENVIGTLESSDYTLVGFDIFKKTEIKDLSVNIEYTDIVGDRRNITKNVQLDLVEKKQAAQSNNTFAIIIIIAVAAGIGYFIYRKKRGKKIEAK